MRKIVASVLVLVAGFAHQGAYAAAAPAPMLSAPPGVILGDVLDGEGKFLWRYMATASAKALYTYDADGDAGKPTCVDVCAQEFIPYMASANAAASGDWSTVVRGPKQKQWVYKGHPLYYYTGTDPFPRFERKNISNTRPTGLVSELMDPGSTSFSPKQGWRRAAFVPEETVAVPAGITLKSIAVANGYGFVDKSTDLPLYVMKTAPKNPHAWKPMYAPNLADRVGDFSIILREDGKRQWAYKDQALYSYVDDYSPDDLNGMAAQSDARPALAYQHFMPRSVHIEFVPYLGPLMVTAKGLTLYEQSRGSGRGSGRRQRGGYKIAYDQAKAVGTKGCVDACLQTRKPLLADAHDEASGFFEIQERADGSRQWAYKGSPLYTYADDKHLGDIEGNNRRDIIYGDPDGKNYDLVTLTGGNRGPNFRPYAGSALFWHIVSLYD